MTRIIKTIKVRKGCYKVDLCEERVNDDGSAFKPVDVRHCREFKAMMPRFRKRRSDGATNDRL